ncbi:hypothetical protein PVAP13_9NG074169 [Panicum virgatum]|uniref:Uncharacterized protein n=1 Tax=Panicum virgatum TaxID=38727 RepID=A0A8T0MEY2_PANVG|nr:hypothetical protein PVAP13_9NG074169 [Panicum virgatum]
MRMQGRRVPLKTHTHTDCTGELNPIRNQCLPWHRPTNLGPRGRTVEEVPAWTAQETFSSSLRQRGCQIMVG